MNLCCKLNGIRCFNADCGKNLGCADHFEGETQTLVSGDIYPGCISCHHTAREFIKVLVADARST